MPSLLQLALGLEGLSLLRGWPMMGDPEIAQRVDDLRALVEAPLESFEVPERDVLAGYAAWAETYDRPGNPVIQIEQLVVQELLAGIPKGRVLDAACGTGRHAAYLASLGHQVVAVDTTFEMLRRVPVAPVCRGDLQALPLASQSFGGAVCSLALTHCPDLGPPVAELARVLRPGGTLVLSDIHPCAVLLGTQAFYRGADGNPGFVRNYMHPAGAYLLAFQKAGLEVCELIEPTFRPEHALFLLTGVFRRFPHLKGPMESAIDGVPAIAIWHLRRA